MRYLAHIKPPKEFEEYIQSIGVAMPSLGLHCTLLHFDLLEKGESGLVRVLSRIKFAPFNITISGFYFLDGNSYCAIVEPKEPLKELHKQIVAKVRGFNKNPHLFDEMLGRYVLENYNPHITLCRGKAIKVEYPLEMLIDRFYLSKKREDGWVEVQSFEFSKNT